MQAHYDRGNVCWYLNRAVNSDGFETIRLISFGPKPKFIPAMRTLSACEVIIFGFSQVTEGGESQGCCNSGEAPAQMCQAWK